MEHYLMVHALLLCISQSYASYTSVCNFNFPVSYKIASLICFVNIYDFRLLIPCKP